MVGQSKNNKKAWLYLSPTLLLMFVFTFFPLFVTVLIAFSEDFNRLTFESSGMGFGNFVSVLRHPDFKYAFTNTAIIAFVSVPLSIIIALLIAVGLNSIKPLREVFQTIFFLPYVTNTIAIGMVFSVMFDGDYSLINSLIGMVGIDPVNWLKGTYWQGMTVVLIYSVWSGLAFKILIFTAGLQNIGKQYYDAAKIDGTPKHRVLTKITIPLLSPMIMYVTITSFIGGFKVYSSIIALFGPTMGVDYRYQTMVGMIYASLDRVDQMGIAAAGAVILFLFILLFTFVNFQVGKRRIHY